jgi:hypothetical protein
MVLHKTMIDIELPIFWLVSLVPIKIKDRKLRNVQTDFKKTKNLKTKNKRWKWDKIQIEDIISRKVEFIFVQK